MNEAYLKRQLVLALRRSMPGAVVFRHEDKFTAGVPDISCTWRDSTAWIEVKYKRGGKAAGLTPLQGLTLLRLGARAFRVTYREASAVMSACVDVARYAPGGLSAGARGLDHEWVASLVRAVLDDKSAD